MNHAAEPLQSGFPCVGSKCACGLDRYHVKVFVARQQVGADSLLSADANPAGPPSAGSPR